MSFKLIMTESTDKQPLFEDKVSVELPDSSGVSTTVSVDAGPMYDFLYRAIFK